MFRCMCTGFPLRSSCVVSFCFLVSTLLLISSVVPSPAGSSLVPAGCRTTAQLQAVMTTNYKCTPWSWTSSSLFIDFKAMAAHPLCSHFLVHPFWRQSANSPSCDRQVGPSLVSHGQWRRCKRLKWWDIIDLDWPVYAVWLSHRMVIWCSFVTTEFS